MTGLLNALRIVIQVFPALVELVRAIEQVIPAKGIGAQKLELLKGIVEDAYQALAPEDRKAMALERLLLAVASIAHRLVAFFNATGVFQKRLET